MDIEGLFLYFDLIWGHYSPFRLNKADKIKQINKN